MKRYLTILSLAVTAVLAFAAMSAASASATQPYFQEKNNNPVTTPIGFTSKQLTKDGEETLPIRLETVNNRRVECKAGTNEGEITSENQLKVTVKFTECKAVTPSEVSCNNITTNPLEGHLYYTQEPELVKNPGTQVEEETNVVLQLKPVTGTVLASFKCGFGLETLEVTGTVLGFVVPINGEHSTTGYLVFRQQKDAEGKILQGHQDPEFYENQCESKEDVLMTKGSGLEPFGPERSAEETTDEITFKEPIQVVATHCE